MSEGRSDDGELSPGASIPSLAYPNIEQNRSLFCGIFRQQIEHLNCCHFRADWDRIQVEYQRGKT
jgi:hypothetical protein